MSNAADVLLAVSEAAQGIVQDGTKILVVVGELAPDGIEMACLIGGSDMDGTIPDHMLTHLAWKLHQTRLERGGYEKKEVLSSIAQGSENAEAHARAHEDAKQKLADYRAEKAFAEAPWPFPKSKQ